MNIRPFTTLAIAGAVLTTMALASVAEAQGHGHRGDRGGGHGMRGGWGTVEIFDLNEDGQITQAEIDEFRANQITEFDTDGDGQLTLDEYQALWLDAMRERMVDRFQDHDDDGDAIVTLEEFSEPYAALVERRDQNGDGVLSAEDMRRGRRGDRGDDRGTDQE